MERSGKTLSKSTSGLRMVPTNELSSSPFALEEPAWIPDQQVTLCLGCQKNFDFFNRRHHCRRCGRCYCSSCCSHNLRLDRMYFIDPVKQCYECAVLSKAEEDFYSDGLTVLMNGRQFNILDRSWDGEIPKPLGMYLCRLSPDHRMITFTPSKPLPRDALPPSLVQLTHVIDVVLKERTKEPLAGLNGLKIYYKDDVNVTVVHCIQLDPADERSQPWVRWAYKALQMTAESKNQEVHQ